MAGATVAWGLDVGITSLKAMKLRRESSKVVLEAFDVIDHDTYLSEPDVDKDEIIRSSLRKFLDRNPIRNETLFIGVPGSSTFARFVKLPPVDPKKIPEIVRFEAIQQIPFPLDQVNWDYQTFTNPDSPEVEVGIFAMKKELVGQVLSNFRVMGLTVHGVQMSPLAIYNAAMFDDMTEGKGTVAIDMGAEHTDLVIIDQGRLWLRTINIGGNHFTDALAKSFKQPFNRAEQLKKTAATSKYQKQIFQAMRPIFADLVAEIQRSIGHYNSSHRDSRLERIIGMGNPFRLPNLQKYLQQELKMEVIRLDTFRKVEADGRLAAGLTENILPMTASYGLALQGLSLARLDTNLLPMEIARQMLWKKKRPWFYGTAAAVVAGAVALGYQSYSVGNTLDSTNTKEKQASNDTAIKNVNDLQAKWANVPNTFENDKKVVDTTMRLGTDRVVWPMITMDLLNSLPQKSGGTPIVILSIDSEYKPNLSNVTDFGTGVGGMPGMPVQSAGPAQAGGSAEDRGFVIKIRGYTRATKDKNGQIKEGFTVAGEYYQALLKPKQGRPYVFEAVPASAQIVGDTDLNPPWGVARGGSSSYYAEFVEDVTGIKAETRPAFTASARPVEVGQGDLFAKQPGGGPLPTMADTFRFYMNIKVHLKEGTTK